MVDVHTGSKRTGVGKCSEFSRSRVGFGNETGSTESGTGGLAVSLMVCNHGRMTFDAGRLSALGRRNRKLNSDLRDLRKELVPEVLAAARAGVRQVEIVELSGYTREHVRRLCRAAGIEAVE